jgi:hypothetical protein
MSVSPSAAPTPRRIIALDQSPPELPKNLSALSSDQILGFLTDLSDYNPLLIKDALKDLGFAGLSKSADGVFAVSTEAFDMQLKRMGNATSLGIGNTNIGMPTIEGSSAASAIQWTTNPYGSEKLDAPVLSLSVLGKDGKEIPVNNLSTPITLQWNVATDERFETPPSYIIDCVKMGGYIFKNNTYTPFTNYTRVGEVWSVPCLLGLVKQVACSPMSTIIEYSCPAPVLTPVCMFWDTINNTWSSDGCIPELVGRTMKCHCTHLTDFTSRVNAVAEKNAAVFANAGNVYSVEGLAKYANWYGIFGGIALLTIILGSISSRIDYITTQKYVVELYNNKAVKEFMNFKPSFPIYIYSRFMKYDDVYEKTPEKDFSLLQRVCFQHNRLQFLFRYDPRLSRMFRVLSLFVLQFHSLFITALLYGFTYNNISAPMQWYDNIILSLITSALNIPAIRILLGSMNYIGMHEFTHQFPYLSQEYKRRVAFEKLALVYLNKQKDLAADEIETSMVDNGDTQENILDTLAIYLCCRGRSVKENLKKLEKEELLYKMKDIVEASFVKSRIYDKAWSIFPCHTYKGLLFMACAFGWLGWCLNYLLLFSASHQQSVGENIMISYATSELMTVFISQPLSILVSIGAFTTLHKYSGRFPNFIKNMFVIKGSKEVPALHFFSNPWNSQSKTMLTSEFAYALFIQAPARASGVSELSYAPVKAVIPSLVNEDHALNRTNERILELYKKFIDTKIKVDEEY